MTKEQIYDYIEKYINGELTDQELNDFKSKMENDKEFSKEVQLHTRISREFSDRSKIELRKTLSEIQKTRKSHKVKTLFSRYRNLISIAAILLLLVTVWMIILDKNQVGPAENLIADEDKNQINKENDSAPFNMEEIAQKRPQPDDLGEGNPESTEPNSVEDQNNQFQTSNYFEELIAQNNPNREGSYSVITSDATFEKDGGNSMVITGKIKSINKVDSSTIIINLYASRQSNNILPLKELGVQLEEDDDQVMGFGAVPIYTYKGQVSINLDPGVYYYIIKDQSSDTILHVEKIVIEE